MNASHPERRLQAVEEGFAPAEARVTQPSSVTVFDTMPVAGVKKVVTGKVVYDARILPQPEGIIADPIAENIPPPQPIAPGTEVARSPLELGSAPHPSLKPEKRGIPTQLKKFKGFIKGRLEELGVISVVPVEPKK